LAAAKAFEKLSADLIDKASDETASQVIRRPTLAAWFCYFISGKSYANVAHSIEEARLSEQGN
jgi:hypothetical protein